MALEVYRMQGTKKLRCGYTTGTCAALAAQAAARALLLGERPEEVSLRTPKGVLVTAPALELETGSDWARCAVQKDAGDDVDATDGILIYACVRRRPGLVTVDGGEGVGRVTKPGLDQPVGAAAINRVPRQMILAQVQEILKQAGLEDGLEIVISAPQGRQLAQKTFNPNLGIVGGISILGVSGIVEPQSLQALLDSIEVEIKMLAAQGWDKIVVTPGNYGQGFLERFPEAQGWPQIKCANFVGDTMDLCAQYGFRQVLLVGHIGKFVKLAGGVTNTHSRVADCRMEIFASYAALAGADRVLVGQILEAATTDQCIALLDEKGLRQPVLTLLLGRIQYHIQRRAAGAFQTGAVVFSNEYGLLGWTEEARQMTARQG